MTNYCAVHAWPGLNAFEGVALRICDIAQFSCSGNNTTAIKIKIHPYFVSEQGLKRRHEQGWRRDEARLDVPESGGL